jgi:homogentisate 1,2-dioxygenase
MPLIHSNISDEVLYYVDGDFMSRNNIEQGHIAPKGIPHGPAPGAMERSIGHNWYRNGCDGRYLQTANGYREAMGLDDGQYYKSWVESHWVEVTFSLNISS